MEWLPISSAPRDGTLILAAESYYRDCSQPYVETHHPRISNPETFAGRMHSRDAMAVIWLDNGSGGGWYNAGSWQHMVTFDPDIWTPIEIPGRVEGWPA